MVWFTIPLLVALQTPPTVEPTKVDPRLERGDVLLKSQGDATLIITAIIEAPPDKVWALVGDCRNYKNTMPSILESDRLSADGNVVICRVVADAPFPLPDLVSVSRAVLTPGPPVWKREWTFVEGDYKRNEGSWVLVPHGVDGQRTLATYTITAVPKIPLPAAVVKSAQESKLPEVLRGLQKRFPKAAKPTSP